MDQIKNQRQVMHVSVRRERMERNEAERRVDRRGGKGRRCRANGNGTSQMNDPEPQYTPQPEHQMEA